MGPSAIPLSPATSSARQATAVTRSLAIAVISDVHGNAPALERVLTDIRGRVPDIVINLGDQVWGQVDPAGAYEMQAELSAVEVRGNNDARPLLPDARLNSVNVALKRWIKERVPVDALNRLASLPLSASVGDGRVLAAHGTPSSPWTA